MLCVAVSCMVLVGCSGKDNNSTTSSGTSSGGASSSSSGSSNSGAAEVEKLEGSLISATPKTFTYFSNFSNMPFNPEWQVWQAIAEATNIHLEGTISQSNSNEVEAFNLMISSGKLADIISYTDASDIEKLGRDGGVIPLNDLIAQYAPHIQETLDTDPKFRQAATSLDGNIYIIPKTQELVSAEFYWIRKDWLDILGLEVPTTVDELYNVLTAFRNGDPNGNGLKDEIPLMDRAGTRVPDEYLFLFDTSIGFYPHDGAIIFEPLDKENFVYGVTELAKWYAEGLIDPEILTRGPKSRDILYGGNLSGFTHDWPSAGNYNRTLAESVPGFKNIPIPPPANQHGEVIERTTRYPSAGWSISAQCDDPITVIKYFDYFFTEEGTAFVNWGIEGDSYVVNEKGDKEFTPKVMNSSEMDPLGYLRSIGVQYRIGMKQEAAYEYAFMTPEAAEATALYNAHPEWYQFDIPALDGDPLFKYTPGDESEYKRIMSQIKPYMDEMFQKWFLGTSNIDDDYDKFVAELKKRGIERATEINQAAYDRVAGK